MNSINQKVADKDNVFYWQTDRAVSPEEAGKIWADRHRYFTDKGIQNHLFCYLRGLIAQYFFHDRIEPLQLTFVLSTNILAHE